MKMEHNYPPVIANPVQRRDEAISIFRIVLVVLIEIASPAKPDRNDNWLYLQSVIKYLNED